MIKCYSPGLFVLTIACAVSIQAQQPRHDKKLQQELENLTRDFRGTLGIYVYNLKTGREAAINADSIFPTASIVKVPILVGLFDKIEKNQLGYHQELLYHDSIKYGGSGLMQFFKDSTKTDVSVLAALMISYSDNTTALWNQSLAGGGTSINSLFEGFGFIHTRVNSRTTGREAMKELYGWGQTTPREMAQILIRIRRATMLSQAASDRMYRLLTHVYYDDYAMSGSPPYIQVAAKQGMVDDSRSELVMVNAPHGDYVFYIATKNIKDQTWKHDNEAWVLARKLSNFLWNYYEPKLPWHPAPGSEKYSDE
jgi:beta-lactamase class A